MWKLIEGLQQENASVSLALAQEAIGNPPFKRQHKIYKDLQKRLESLIGDLTEKKKRH